MTLLPPGALYVVSPEEGDSPLGTPMEWMAHKYAGCVGVVVDVRVSEDCHPGGVRVPLLVMGAVRGFDRRHLRAVED